MYAWDMGHSHISCAILLQHGDLYLPMLLIYATADTFSLIILMRLFLYSLKSDFIANFMTQNSKVLIDCNFFVFAYLWFILYFLYEALHSRELASV